MAITRLSADKPTITRGVGGTAAITPVAGSLAVPATTDVATAALVNDDASATTAALSASYVDTGLRRAPLVSALTYPLVIAHRGGANLAPENTLEAFRLSAAMGLQAIEGGDIQAASDGTLLTSHDLTFDRVSTGSGNISTLTGPWARTLTLDSSSWFGGNWADITGMANFDQILDEFGGRSVLFPEVKDVLDATTSAMIAAIVARGLTKSVVICSSNLTNLALATAAGIPTMYLWYSSSVSGIPSAATLTGQGIDFVGIGIETTGGLAATVTSLKAGGLRVIGFTADHQVDYDTAITTNGLDGVFSNDPIYVARQYTKYRRAATTWAQSGTWGHGFTQTGGAGSAVVGPFTTTQRGTMVGAAGLWRWRPPNAVFVVPGEVVPVPSPAGTYTITVVTVFDVLPGTTSEGACIFACAANDSPTNFGGNLQNSYLIKVRGTGVINAWSINNAGSATSLGGVTATAPSIPTLSSGLTAGVAITSIPVNALTVALKIGHQFVLPTGQVITLTAAASVSATSLTVASVTPSAAVASAASLLPRITVTIAVTPTTVTIGRADETTATPLAASNTLFRGAYIALQNAVTAPAQVSFESVAVA